LVEGCDPGDSKELAEEATTLTLKSYKPTIPKPPKLIKAELTFENWRDFYPMSDEVLADVNVRGISEEVIKANKTG
jgi:hypothetical protein